MDVKLFLRSIPFALCSYNFVALRGTPRSVHLIACLEAGFSETSALGMAAVLEALGSYSSALPRWGQTPP